MTSYQVEYRAYCAEYERDPPPFQADTRSNITTDRVEAIKRMNQKLDELSERAKCVSFPSITEVRIVSEKGILLSKTIKESPSFR